MGLELVQTPIKTDFQASEITITAKDPNTGETIIRKLPVTFKENHFGIWLEGEDELGNPQAVVIFNAAGRNHVQEVIAVDYAKEVIEWNGNSLNVI